MNRVILTYLLIFLTISCVVRGQNSPLATGKWVKIGAIKQGIYKLTGAQLSSLGFSLPLASSQIQLYSFDLTSLKDKVPAIPQSGLTENAIKVMDGGDGQINASDYILFYNQGPVYWKFDSLLNRTMHTNFSSADTVYYFLTMGQNGKRLSLQKNASNATISKASFSQYLFFEKDSISLLNSGKTWYGPAMGQGPKKILQTINSFSTQGMNASSQLKIWAKMASTSYQSNGQFDFIVNDQLIHTTYLPTVSGLLFDDMAAEKLDSMELNKQAIWPQQTSLKIGYTNSTSTATGWIDYLELKMKKPIGFWQDSTIDFNIDDSLTKGSIANCAIQNMDSSSIIWNVTHVQEPKEIGWTMSGNGLGEFLQPIDSAVHFFGVKQNAFEVPYLLGPVQNQNTLQNNVGVEYIIITAPAYMNAAKKYQQFQIAKLGRKTIVVNANEIYHDFSGGQVTAVAIRNFLKTQFNSAIQQNQTAPKYLLLLGIGNFNIRKINVNNELPSFESGNSNSILASFSTDDFFAILEDNADLNNYNSIQQLALSVGRIPARNASEADSVIHKLMNYQTNTIGGLWGNKITWVADDGDYNLHLQDAEFIIHHLQNSAVHWDHQKIYLDFFPAVNTTSGNTYPLAFNAIKQSVQEGSLLVNYTGHGNYLRLSEEAVIAQNQFDLWDNAGKLPLMVTASCNFAPYDQPGLPSIAWDALMKNRNGIIGLVAANRLVFANSNKQINDLFIQQLLVSNQLGKYKTLGEALQNAKNLNWSLGGDKLNDFKFNLMGDPGMQLFSPKKEIIIQQINDKVFSGLDTLMAGNKYSIKGSIMQKGLMQSNVNGQIELTIYDGIKTKKTLANQSTSMSVPITVQENILFKGKASVINGAFKIDFILPMQMANAFTPIRIELATLDSINAAILIQDSIYIIPNTQQNTLDRMGPHITAFINNPLFKNGDWVMPNSTLYIQLSDSAGIQTSGNVLGQDLTIWIDQDPVPIVLNNYFNADVDTYQSGKVQYALPTLSVGSHQLIIKAWDLLGNSNSDTILFEVPNGEHLVIKNAMNYPNPMREKSRFSVEINQIGATDQVVFEVFDWAGHLLYQNKSNQIIYDTRFLLDWDGKTAAGAKLFPGIYFYRFSIHSNQAQQSITNTFLKL